MNAAEWIVIDTETTGLEAPIFVIEVHAQRMLGWQTLGEPFTAYLNHKVPVPADAVAVHGITAEFLESHGLDPHEVHTSLLDYIGSRPVTAHNLNYDWDRCLIPEWSRLGLQLSVQARKGFCSMLLGRRILPETRSVALQTLANLYGMTRDKLHSASGDVAITIQLLTTIYRERLERAGVGTYQEVEKFSRQTPVRDCHQRIFGDAVPAFLTSPIVLTSLSANNVSGTQAAFREGCSLVPMDQRSPEWIRWHHSGIGSSDASVIMGVDPWRTPVDLYLEKVLRPMGKRMSVAMQQGVGIEGAARLSYSQFKGATVNPACVQSNTCGWLRASIDGLSADGTVAVEIKGGQHTYREVQRSRQVPAHYYAQLQHILLVTGLHSIDFWCYLDRRQPLFMVVERDCAYISRLFAAEKAFWEELQDEATSLAVPSITAKSIVVSSLQIPLPQKPS